MRLFADYLHDEYGDLDSDYVFVNLWGRPHGHPLGYPAVYDLVRRLRRSTGIDFDPHWWRHTYATRLLRDGTPIEVVSKLLGHASITTTLSFYTPRCARSVGAGEDLTVRDGGRRQHQVRLIAGGQTG